MGDTSQSCIGRDRLLRRVLLDLMMSRNALPWPGSDGVTVEEVLVAYIPASERGRVPDEEELIRRHQELASEIRTFFTPADNRSRQATDRANSSTPRRSQSNGIDVAISDDEDALAVEVGGPGEIAGLLRVSASPIAMALDRISRTRIQDLRRRKEQPWVRSRGTLPVKTSQELPVRRLRHRPRRPLCTLGENGVPYSYLLKTGKGGGVAERLYLR
jgi:hypothetical protein